MQGNTHFKRMHVATDGFPKALTSKQLPSEKAQYKNYKPLKCSSSLPHGPTTLFKRVTGVYVRLHNDRWVISGEQRWGVLALTVRAPRVWIWRGAASGYTQTVYFHIHWLEPKWSTKPCGYIFLTPKPRHTLLTSNMRIVAAEFTQIICNDMLNYQECIQMWALVDIGREHFLLNEAFII